MKASVPDLVLPPRYENIAQILDRDSARMMEIILPLQKYERQLTAILKDVKRNAQGYVVFIQGVSGIGKTTFINSLELRKNYLPVRTVIDLDSEEFTGGDGSSSRLPRIFSRLREIARQEEQFTNRDIVTCVALNYLENLHAEPETNVVAFFRDLNGFLRKVPLLLLWPITKQNDLNSILELTRSVSATLASPRQPVIDFGGPPMEKFADIAKNTMRVLNDGRPIHDFQLVEEDFEDIRKSLADAPKDHQTIGTYLQLIRELWEERTEYIRRLSETVPDPTEVWFMVGYPEAENQVERFSHKAFSVVEDNWNINFAKLSEYVYRNQQRGAEWPGQRLLYALRVFRAKILYLPTNSFVNAVAAFGSEVPRFPIPKERFQEWGVPSQWFAKSKARLTLGTSPIIRQLVGREPKVGSRGGGENRQMAVTMATESFKQINEGISVRGEYSDTPFNRALAFALDAAYHHPPNRFKSDFPPHRPKLIFSPEQRHQWLNIVPDITIKGFNDKTICVEMHYTFAPQDNDIADYILKKLNVYMAQYEQLLIQPPLKTRWLRIDS